MVLKVPKIVRQDGTGDLVKGHTGPGFVDAYIDGDILTTGKLIVVDELTGQDVGDLFYLDSFPFVIREDQSSPYDFTFVENHEKQWSISNTSLHPMMLDGDANLYVVDAPNSQDPSAVRNQVIARGIDKTDGSDLWTVTVQQIFDGCEAYPYQSSQDRITDNVNAVLIFGPTSGSPAAIGKSAIYFTTMVQVAKSGTNRTSSEVLLHKVDKDGTVTGVILYGEYFFSGSLSFTRGDARLNHFPLHEHYGAINANTLVFEYRQTGASGLISVNDTAPLSVVGATSTYDSLFFRAEENTFLSANELGEFAAIDPGNGGVPGFDILSPDCSGAGYTLPTVGSAVNGELWFRGNFLYNGSEGMYYLNGTTYVRVYNHDGTYDGNQVPVQLAVPYRNTTWLIYREKTLESSTLGIAEVALRVKGTADDAEGMPVWMHYRVGNQSARVFTAPHHFNLDPP